MTDREKALMRVQTYGFALDEAALFSDTHPDSAEALDYYHRAVADYENAVKRYVDAFGPLTRTQVKSRERWTWVDGCMPWEADCNVEL